MQQNLLESLREAMPGLLCRSDVPFREITSFGVGGKLPVLAQPVDDVELSKLFKFLAARRIPYLLLGAGSNMIGMDRDFEGVGIRLDHGMFAEIRVGHHHLTCGSAVRLAELARKAAEGGFGGLAQLAGIPGTLGGALRMNASAHGVAIGDRVLQLCGCRTDGSIWTAEGHEIEWSYRHSSIPADVVITSAILSLPSAEPGRELDLIREEIAARRAHEPKGRSAGCFFVNPSPDEPAGRLIDAAGLKGAAIGSAEVSREHANYLVNRGNVSAAELLALAIQIRRSVADKFGIYLRPEVVFADPADRETLMRSVPAPKVAVLMGGNSSEREISLRSGKAVAMALRNAGYEVVEVDLHQCEITPEMRSADIVYPVLHGGFGEDGKIQKLMEEAGIDFVASGSASCDLVMDKIATKRRLDELNMPTAPWGIITTACRELPCNLDYPVIVKAPREGSTIGIAKVDAAEQWDAALDQVFLHDSVLLVEKFIKGIEATVPLLSGKALPVVEIRSPHGFYDYDAKYVYKDGKTEYFCPAVSLSEEQQHELARLSERFFAEFGCRDILRVDFIIDGDGHPYILEGNAIPGCTATSLVPKAARAVGISFERLTASLVQAAMRRKREAKLW